MNGRDPVGWQQAGLPLPEAAIVPTQESIVHAHRRRRALDRLEGLTTGLAVAGVAGTAGFAILAAASWSGVPGARTVNDLPAVVGNVGGASGGSSSGGSGSGGSGGVTQPVDPNGGRSTRTAARRQRLGRLERDAGHSTGPARPAAVRPRDDGRLRLAELERRHRRHLTRRALRRPSTFARDRFVTSGPGADRSRRRP